MVWVFLPYLVDSARVDPDFSALMARFAAYLCTFVTHFVAYGRCRAALAGRGTGCFLGCLKLLYAFGD